MGRYDKLLSQVLRGTSDANITFQRPLSATQLFGILTSEYVAATISLDAQISKNVSTYNGTAAKLSRIR